MTYARAFTISPISCSCFPVVNLGNPANLAENLDFPRIAARGRSHICTLTMSFKMKIPLHFLSSLKLAFSAKVIVAYCHMFFVSILNRTIFPNLLKMVLTQCSLESRGISVTLIDLAGKKGAVGATSRGRNVRFSRLGKCTVHV